MVRLRSRRSNRGDEVLAYDRAAGEARLAEVVRVFEREVDEVWLLTAGDGDSTPWRSTRSSSWIGVG